VSIGTDYARLPVQFLHESNGRFLCSLLTIPTMKKIILANDSVTETAGVFEDLAAVEEHQTNISETDIYLIAQDSIKDCIASHKRVKTSSDTAKS